MNSIEVGVGVVSWLAILVFFAIGFALAAFVVRMVTRKGSLSSTAVGVFFFGGLLIGTFLFLFLVFFLRSSSQTAIVTQTATASIPVNPQTFERVTPSPSVPQNSTAYERPSPPIQPDSTTVTMNPDRNAIAMVQLSSPPTEWMSNDLNAFDADVYPGVVQAAAPLARQVRAELEANRLIQKNSTGDGFVEPQQIIIAANLVAPEDRQSVIKNFTAEIRKHFDQASVSTTESSVDSSFGNIVVLRIDSQNAQRAFVAWDNQFNTVISGTLHCDARTQLGQANVAVKYAEKPWVESFGAFSMERPNKQFIAGYSTSLASSESEARREAMVDAFQKLKQSSEFMHLQLTESMACDRFVQKLSRPYGDVWRVALLFELSSPTVAAQAIATMKDQAMTSVSVRSRASIFAMLVLFLLTIVLSVVLNLLTLGYYRMQISMGWAALVLGIVVVGGLMLIGIG